MAPTFTRPFSGRGEKVTDFRGKGGGGGGAGSGGKVYIAPGGMQTTIEKNGDALRIRVAAHDGRQLYAPSVDRLFESASNAVGKGLIAVVLTGMGDDGARAIRQVRDRGGRTIAEAEQSAITNAMPREAIKNGDIESGRPLRGIPYSTPQFSPGNGTTTVL